MKDCGQYFEAMRKAYKKSAGASLNAVYQFELTGEGGGEWVVTLRNGELSVSAGRCERPDVTLTASAQDYSDIAEGRLGGMRAFATRRLKVRGNLALAMKLRTLFASSPNPFPARGEGE